jgi:hypothetical protein
MDTKGYQYRGFEIKMFESTEFSTYSYKGPQEYAVTGNGHFIYKASCDFGTAYAVKPEDALNMAKELIDENTKASGN